MRKEREKKRHEENGLLKLIADGHEGSRRINRFAKLKEFINL